MTPFHPQPWCSSERTSTTSASPGSAPATATGPVSGWISSSIRAPGTSCPLFGVTWPVPSSVSKTTVSPGSIVTRGGSSRSQKAWGLKSSRWCSAISGPLFDLDLADGERDLGGEAERCGDAPVLPVEQPYLAVAGAEGRVDQLQPEPAGDLRPELDRLAAVEVDANQHRRRLVRREVEDTGGAV